MKKKLVITILCALSANATLDAAQYDQLKQAISIAPHQVRLALNTLRLESIHNPGLTENLQKKIDATSKQTLAKRTCAAYADIRQQNLKLAQLESSSDIKAIQDKILTVFTKDEQNEVGLRFNEINASQGCLGYISRKTEEGIQDNLRAVNNLLESGLAGRKSIDTASIIEAYAAFNALDATFLKQAERSSLSISALSGFAGFCLAGLMVMSYYLYMMDHVSNPAPTQGVEEFGNCIETAGQTRINMASILSSCANAVGVNLGQIATAFVGAYLFSNASENKLTTLADNAMTTNTAAQRQLSIAATDLANATKILNSTACSQTAKREFVELAALPPTTAAPTNATGPAYNAIVNATHNMQNTSLELKALSSTWQNLIDKLSVNEALQKALNIFAENIFNITAAYNASIISKFTQTQTAVLIAPVNFTSNLLQYIQDFETTFAATYPAGVATNFMSSAMQCFRQAIQDYTSSAVTAPTFTPAPPTTPVPTTIAAATTTAAPATTAAPNTTAAPASAYASCLLDAQTKAIAQNPNSQQLNAINQHVAQMTNETTGPDVIFSDLINAKTAYLVQMEPVFNAFITAVTSAMQAVTNCDSTSISGIDNSAAYNAFAASMSSLNVTEALKQNTLNNVTRQLAATLNEYVVKSVVSSTYVMSNCPMLTIIGINFMSPQSSLTNARAKCLLDNIDDIAKIITCTTGATEGSFLQSYKNYYFSCYNPQSGICKATSSPVTDTVSSDAALGAFVTFYKTYMNGTTTYLQNTLAPINKLATGILQAISAFIKNNKNSNYREL